MRRAGLVLGTGYGLALLLVVLPLLGPIVPLLPLEPGNIRWRLQAFGSLTQVVVVPLLGLTLALAVAYSLVHRVMLRLLAVIAFLGALGLAGAATIYVLDFIQYRWAVEEQLRQYYHVAGAVYLVVATLAIAFLLWLCAVGWSAGARGSHRFGKDEADRLLRPRSHAVRGAAAPPPAGD